MNTISGVDVSTFVRLMLDDTDATSYTFSDTDLNAFLAEAVRDYSAYNPYLIEDTFLTVDGTALYKLASAATRIVEVQYRVTAVTGATIVDDVPDFLPDLYWLGDEALTAVRQRLRQRYNASGDGAWEQLTGLTSFTAGLFVVLYPTPDEASTITYRYEAAHPLVGTNYPTIPPRHVETVRDWTIALGKLGRAVKLRSQPFDYTAGQTRVRIGLHADGLVKEGQAELARVRQAVQRVTAQWG